MGKSEIYELIKNKFNNNIAKLADDSIDATISVKPENLREIIQFIKDNESLAFNVCHSISGLDTGVENSLSVVYHFTSFEFHHWLTVKVLFEGRKNCEVATISDIYDGADWLEREVYDLFGIIFSNHPDLRRILTPDDWEGHPLLKDYEAPEIYQNVKNKPENDWNSNAFKFPE